MMVLTLPFTTNLVWAHHSGYHTALAHLAAGNKADAAAALQRFAEHNPTSPHAAEALFSAGKLCEEQLAQPAQAMALYELLVAKYPHSRVTKAAESRGHALQQMGSTRRDLRALTQWQHLIYTFDKMQPAESLRRAQQLVDENPQWPGVTKVLLWMANLHRRAGRPKKAMRSYERALESTANAHDHYLSLRGIFEMALEASDFARARAALHALPKTLTPAQAHDRDQAFSQLARERARHSWYWLSFAVLGTTWLALASAVLRRLGLSLGLRALAQPPTEAIYFFPLAILLVALSLTGPREISPAVAIICGAGFLTTWLCASALRDAPTSLPWTALRILAALCAGLAAVYLAMHRTRLLDLLMATVRFGPDT